MTHSEYVKEYFSKHASKWLMNAYDDEQYPARYPTGFNRTRITLEIITDHLSRQQGRVLDLGCGGGDLCMHAAELGVSATGIDIAEGMIQEAKERRSKLSPEVADRVTFEVGDALNTGLPEAGFDVVVALGVIEYLQEDAGLFREAWRLLKPGGVVIVSCRNRLFNASTANTYTLEEIKQQALERLVGESMEATQNGVSISDAKAFLQGLEKALPGLREALVLDEAQKPGNVKPKFSAERRQHTPGDLWESAQTQGFKEPRYWGINPHPFPLEFKYTAPRFFAQMAKLYEVFERSPISLSWSSAFIGVFQK